MRFTLCTFLLICNLLFIFCAEAQKILIIERPGTIKNFKFYEGDEIHIRIKNNSTTLNLKGNLTNIKDSCIIIDYNKCIPLVDIRTVYKERYGIKLTESVLLISGIGYFVLDTFNRAINKDVPVVEKETAIISSSITAAGLALTPFRERKLNVGKKWRIKVLSFD